MFVGSHNKIDLPQAAVLITKVLRNNSRYITSWRDTPNMFREIDYDIVSIEPKRTTVHVQMKINYYIYVSGDGSIVRVSDKQKDRYANKFRLVAEAIQEYTERRLASYFNSAINFKLCIE